MRQAPKIGDMVKLLVSPFTIGTIDDIREGEFETEAYLRDCPHIGLVVVGLRDVRVLNENQTDSISRERESKKRALNFVYSEMVD